MAKLTPVNGALIVKEPHQGFYLDSASNLNQMALILFKSGELSHKDRRDLENLVHQVMCDLQEMKDESQN